MLAKSIRLKHFRSHRHTFLELNQVTFIRGLNKTGKSAIGLAIEMLLAGRCRVTDEGGKGFESLITEGENQAQITVEGDLGTFTLTLDRTAGRTLRAELTNGTVLMQKQAQQWIAENVAAPDIVNAAANAWRFFRLGETDQSSLLARVLLPAKLELDPHINEWLKTNKLALLQRPTLFQTIQATYDAITTARTEVNRRVRDLKNIEEPEAYQGSSDSVKARLQDLEKERDKAKAKLAGRESKAALIEQKRKDIQDANANVVEKQRQIAEIKASLLPKEERDTLTETLNLKAKKAQLEADLNTQEQLFHELGEIINQIAESFESGVCPTCQAAVSEKKKADILSPHLKRQNDMASFIANLKKSLVQIGNIDDADRALAADNQRLNKLNHLTAELVSLGAIAEQHLTSLAQIEAANVQQLDLTEDLGELEKQAIDIQLRIEKGMEALVKVSKLEAEHANYQRKLKERSDATQRLEELEKLIAYFGPKGVKAKLIAERLDVFTSRVNRVLEWWRYSLRFIIEPYSLHLVDAQTGIALNPKQLSDSEVYRLGVAFAVAIAEWTGFKILIADGADILDKHDKWQLAEAIYQTDLDQAIVTSTGLAGTFEAPRTTFYTLSKSEGTSIAEHDDIEEAVA
jgi:hypothetical protein